MRQTRNIFLALVAMVIGLTSCLKKDQMNVDPDELTTSLWTMQWIEAGNGSTINSGLQYFAGGTLLYPPDSEADTATFSVQLSGATPAQSDMVVKVGVDDSKILANFDNDGIEYIKMPDSLFSFLVDTDTIKKGDRVATFKVIFHPAKVDPTKNFMLPVTVVQGGNIPISQNYGHIYFHTIGNPIAGAYNWDFIRYNSATPTGTPNSLSFYGDHTTLVPISPTMVKVPTGYYTAPDYLISFDNDNGVLSNFKAVIDPAQIPDYFTAGNVAITQQPVITVEQSNGAVTKITINYAVVGSGAPRNITDIFYK